MRLLPGANEELIRTFKEYIERQVATSREFMERLLRAKDFQEALGIQVEHFQSQLTAAGEETTQIGAWIVGLANLPRRFLVSRRQLDCCRRDWTSLTDNQLAANAARNATAKPPPNDTRRSSR